MLRLLMSRAMLLLPLSLLLSILFICKTPRPGQGGERTEDSQQPTSMSRLRRKRLVKSETTMISRLAAEDKVTRQTEGSFFPNTMPLQDKRASTEVPSRRNASNSRDASAHSPWSVQDENSTSFPHALVEQSSAIPGQDTAIPNVLSDATISEHRSENKSSSLKDTACCDSASLLRTLCSNLTMLKSSCLPNASQGISSRSSDIDKSSTDLSNIFDVFTAMSSNAFVDLSTISPDAFENTKTTTSTPFNSHSPISPTQHENCSTTAPRTFEVHASVRPESVNSESSISPNPSERRSTTTQITFANHTMSPEISDKNSTISNATLPTVDAINPNVTDSPFAIIHQGMISKKQFEACNLIISVILKPPLCIAGTIMNIIGICVLLNKQLRRSSYIYLCFLSISNVGYLLVGIIRCIPHITSLFDDTLGRYIRVHTFQYIHLFGEFVFVRISVYVICALSMERFVAVLRPLKARNQFLSRHALPVCVALVVFQLLVHGPVVFGYNIISYYDTKRNVTLYATEKKEWFIEYMTVFGTLNGVINICIPPLVVITCNLGILIEIYLAKRARRMLFQKSFNNGGQAKREIRMTLTLLIVALCFLLVFIPVIVVHFLLTFNEGYGTFKREHYFVLLIGDVMAFAWSITSANDFIIYIYTSKEFRQVFNKMFSRKKRGVTE